MPSSLPPTTTIVFHYSDRTHSNSPRARILLQSIPTTTLLHFCSYFASNLASLQHSNYIHEGLFNLSASSSHFPAYAQIARWIASNNPPNPNAVTSFSTSNQSYTQIALLHQVSSKLGIPSLQRQFLQRLESLLPTENDINEVLSIIPVSDISVELIVNDLSRHYSIAYRSYNTSTIIAIEALLDRTHNNKFKDLVRRDIERRSTQPCGCQEGYCCGGRACCVHRFKGRLGHDDGKRGGGHAANPSFLRGEQVQKPWHYVSHRQHTREEKTKNDEYTFHTEFHFDTPMRDPLREWPGFGARGDDHGHSHGHGKKPAKDHAHVQGHHSPASPWDSGYSSADALPKASLYPHIFPDTKKNHYNDDESLFPHPPQSPSLSKASTATLWDGLPAYPFSSSSSSTAAEDQSPWARRRPHCYFCSKSGSRRGSHVHLDHHDRATPHTRPIHELNTFSSSPPSSPPKSTHPCTHLHPHEIEITRQADSNGKTHLSATRARCSRQKPTPPSTKTSDYSTPCSTHYYMVPPHSHESNLVNYDSEAEKMKFYANRDINIINHNNSNNLNVNQNHVNQKAAAHHGRRKSTAYCTNEEYYCRTKKEKVINVEKSGLGGCVMM